MVGFSTPEEADNGGASKGSDGGEIEVRPAPEFDLSEPSDDDNGGEYRDVQFGADGSEMALSVPEAVELAGEMLTNPESFGIATLSRVEELEAENEMLREAVAELAEAVEVLSGNQADMAGVSESGTVLLDADAFGELYDPENGGESGV